MKRKIIMTAILASAAALGIVACSSAPAMMTVNGTAEVADNPAAGIDPPVQVGSQVTVTDPSGKVIGFTTLNGNAAQGPVYTLTFGFTVKVPESESSYGVTVNGLNGTEHYTQKQMQQGPALCAGNGCQ